MPIYEFECKKCGLKFEYLVRKNDDKVACTKCANKNLRRLVSSFAFSSKDGQGNTTISSSGCGGCTSQNCSGCSR